MTIASAPERTNPRASTSAGAKQISLAPPSLTAFTAAPGGMPPASTTWLTFASRQTRTRSLSAGCIVIRLTPNGLLVIACVPAISAASRSGVIEPQAMTPNPPALEIAATRWRSLTQLMAPPMIAIGQPRNAIPRVQSRSSAARSGSASIETIRRVQRAYRELGVFRGDQHADFYFTRGNDLNVDRFVCQSAKHRIGDAGVAAHADPDDADLGDVRILQHLGPRDLILDRGQGHARSRQIGLADGERHVGRAIGGDILNDHVDIDVVIGELAKDGRRDARSVGDPAQGDLL